MSVPVYFYGTCMLDMVSPYTGYHVVRLLEEAGCQVYFPSGQTCCGQPAYNSGYRQEAQKVAANQLDLFPEEYPVLFPSGSCAAMMKHHYHDLFPKEEKVKHHGKKIDEWSRFYFKLNPQLKDSGDPIRVAWHGSCHSLREMKVRDEPISLIKKLSQVELIELTHNQECCGFGGTFAIKYSDISAAMAEYKCQEIIDSGVEALVSSDVGCMTHIRTRLEKMGGRKIIFYHLADFLAERTGVAHPDYRNPTE